MKNEIKELIHEFKVRFRQLQQDQEREAIAELLGGAPPKVKAPPKEKKPRKPRRAGVAVVTSNEATPIVIEHDGNGGGPHVDEMAVQMAVSAYPGRGAAAIAKELGAPGAVVSTLLKKLIKVGTVSAQGKARGTTYYPAGA